MPEIRIEQGETEPIVEQYDPDGWYVQVRGNPVRIGKTKRRAATEGEPWQTHDRGRIQQKERDEALFAYAPEGDAVVDVRNGGFLSDIFSPTMMETEIDNIRKVFEVDNLVNLESKASITSFEYSTQGTGADTLPSHAVPQGVEVAVQALRDNQDLVYVGNDTAQAVNLAPGESMTLRVSNTDVIHIQTPSAGDGVGVTFEG